MHPKSIQTTSLLLGAAFAGLAGIAPEAEAATIHTEVGDFSDNPFEATDLTATWSNFATSGGIAGRLLTGEPDYDYGDYMLVAAPAGTEVSIPFSVTSTIPDPFVFVMAFDGEASPDDEFIEVLAAGVTYNGVLNFTMPSSGQIVLGLYHESGQEGTIDYTFGATVPEASSSMLGLAGMAAAALRRRRKDS